MKTINFNPLRVLPSGKIAVASYAQWRKIKVADNNGHVTLVLNTSYKSMPSDARVFNHKGVNLFWVDYDPETIPLLTGYELEDGEFPERPRMWKTTYGMFSARGLDCDGVPAFSHETPDNIFNSKASMDDYMPLTVGIVQKWLGWFLYELQNTQIQ